MTKDQEQVFIHCHVCGGEGVTYEEDPKHEGSYFQYLCQECGGSGGWWQEVEKE